MMNRLLIRRCSMSSIEEEDEFEESDELVTQIERFPSTTLLPQTSPSVLEWDSELSESEQELTDNYENTDDQVANRVLQNFIQSYSQTHQTVITPFSLRLYEDEEEDCPELDVILNELEEYSQNSSTNLSNMNSYSKSSSLFSPEICVSDLQTLEDQLEAALASLTLTINDCSLNHSDCQIEEQHSSDSSACSSGLGDETGSESFQLYQAHVNPSKITTDDCDSAFSESGSTEKIIPSNLEQPFNYRSLIKPIEETSLIIVDHEQRFFTPTEHPSKILIRTYNDDGSTKSLFVDDSMFIRDVLFLLIHKNHREPDVNYALIEILPELHMERIFEDHQKLTEAILMWPTVSSNRLGFSKRVEKYNFLRTMNSYEQFFTSPNIEGNIYFKEKSRKSWKKYYCVLRSSGLYFIPKGKNKKDLVCLANLNNVELFFGLDWKKKFKSPSDFCFALKHPLIQKKSSKYIKYMCVETKNEFDRWIRNIRIAKFGQQLKINYIMMDQAMNVYRSSGRFTDETEKSVERETKDSSSSSTSDRRTPIPSNQYYTIPSNHEEQTDDSSIKSASYMDELRQRLERVLNDPLPTMKEPMSRSRTLIPPPPKFKPMKSTTTIGSTPLPRKQMDNSGNFSYRTINPIHRHPSQPMSKSFIIPSKQEDHQSVSSLSITSTSDSSSSTFLPRKTRFIKSIVHTPPPTTSSLSLKKPFTSFRTNSSSDYRYPSMKSVPPVPPRKSSIPRPILKPSPPQRHSSNNLFLRKTHTPLSP